MQVKVFEERSRGRLEEAVNAWLQENRVSPASMRTEFSIWQYEDVGEVYTFYVLLVFYVPMGPM